MGTPRLQSSAAAVWKLARNQRGVVSHAQLVALGMSKNAIRNRTDRGRLHRVHRGVYAVGRPELTRYGWWVAALLACGNDALLSHQSAAELWGITKQAGPAMKEGPMQRPRLIHVSVPAGQYRRRCGIRVHRRSAIDDCERTRREGIPVTTPSRTLIDLAAELPSEALEAAINQADKLGLIDPESLRSAVDLRAGSEGVGALRRVLDRRTFRLTDSELERRFLRLVRRAGLPPPRTRQRVNGFLVDFHWPELALVVETDGLRYHRTATQQSRDRLRDQAHTAAGLTALRFTHAQVSFDPARVVAILRAVAERQRLTRLGLVAD